MSLLMGQARFTAQLDLGAWRRRLCCCSMKPEQRGQEGKGPCLLALILEVTRGGGVEPGEGQRRHLMQPEGTGGFREEGTSNRSLGQRRVCDDPGRGQGETL